MLRPYLAIVLLCVSLAGYSQRLHVGVFGGVAAYNGDLTEKIFPKKVTNGVIAGSLSYELTDNILLRGQLSYSILGGADRYSNKADLRARNLSFETKLYEASLVGEYDLLSMYEHRFTPYVFAGVAFYHSTPYVYSPVDGSKVFLRPLRTEGQGLPGYPERKIQNNYQWAIPIGGGIKYAITDKLHLGLELAFRKLFNDYFDDVSNEYADAADLSATGVQYSYRGDELPGGNPAFPAKGTTRGSPKYKDLYYFTGLHLTYRLDFSGNGGAGFSRKNQLGCPTRVY